MDKEEIAEAENLELRISEMKSQFQQSYDVFIKAHEELSKISFEPTNFSAPGETLGPLAKLETKDINEIIDAGSIEECISKLRAKIKSGNEDFPSTFPDVTRLLSIMNGLQMDIESLQSNQKHFAKLTDDVNQEMSLCEKRMEDSIGQLDDLVVESLDGSESSKRDDDEYSGEEEEEETFGSESCSDWI